MDDLGISEASSNTDLLISFSPIKQHNRLPSSRPNRHSPSLTSDLLLSYSDVDEAASVGSSSPVVDYQPRTPSLEEQQVAEFLRRSALYHIKTTGLPA